MADKTARQSKFFRVAVEGGTATDGRTIERNWLTDISGGYNPETYGARINLEHIRGFSPKSDFKAYGDVLAVKTEEVTISLNGKDEKRLALFAQISPTDDLVAMTKDRQKIYTSIEVAPNFAGTGKAGLVGLAVTDTPASLGTEILSFSAKAEGAAVKAMFDSRKADAANHFTESVEVALEFEDAPAAQESALEKFARVVVEKLTGAEPKTPPAEPVVQASAEPASQPDIAAMFKGFSDALAADRKADNAANDKRFTDLAASISGLKADLENTPSPQHVFRPTAAGGETSGSATDC